MAILAFQKPDKVIMLESTDRFGKFEFRPLEPGYGITIGNPLRRILLSSLEGFAITGIKIQGVDHEFATIPGVIEDVTEIILNLKQVRFKRKVEEVENEKLTVVISGQDTFTAGDMNHFLHGFDVLNPELVICNMDPSTSLEMELTIQKGRGYVPASENMPADVEIGFIPIDAIYTPIRNVKYEIENYRVEGKTDYERLLFEIETDGSINPTDALKEAAKILIHHFMLFSDEKITLEAEDKYGNEEFDEEVLHMRQLLKTKLVDMTTAQPEEYTLADSYTFRALPLAEGATVFQDTIHIQLNRSSRLASLQDGYRLTLEIVPNDEVGVGPYERSRAVLRIMQDPVQPEWWTREVSSTLMGDYSPKKYKTFLQNVEGAERLDGVLISQHPDQALKLVRQFKQWLLENPTYEEDGDTLMTVNV